MSYVHYFFKFLVEAQLLSHTEIKEFFEDCTLVLNDNHKLSLHIIPLQVDTEVFGNYNTVILYL